MCELEIGLLSVARVAVSRDSKHVTRDRPMNDVRYYFHLWTHARPQYAAAMAEVDFGDSELFEQLGDTTPVSKHIRFTDDDGDTEETSVLGEKLEECEEKIQTLTDENILCKNDVCPQLTLASARAL